MAFFNQNKGHVTHNICIINAHVFIFERDVQLMNDDTCCEAADISCFMLIILRAHDKNGHVGVFRTRN